MRESFHSVLVSLVDDRSIYFRLQLRYGTFTIVDPKLDEMDSTRMQLPNVPATFFGGRGSVRNTESRFTRWSRHRWRCDAFANRQEFRCVRDDFVAKFVGQLLIGLEAHAHRSCGAVISVALKLVDQILARVVGLLVAAVLLVDEPDM